jgi:hypothetical protein
VLVEKLLKYEKTVDVASVVVGMYLMDTKSRTAFVKPMIALAMKEALVFKLVVSVQHIIDI